MDIHYIHSPIGCFRLSATDVGVRQISLMDTFPASPVYKPTALLVEAENQIQAYFLGRLFNFSIPLDLSGYPDFSQTVWKILQDIPYGKTASYKDIAVSLGNNGLVRAVGQANRINPVPIIVPCHRCIASSGKLQGYVYGLEIKKYLLQLEAKHSGPSAMLLF
jgi:methylated-DNA-[protein]-cysteine S-methyltransferase